MITKAQSKANKNYYQRNKEEIRNKRRERYKLNKEKEIDNSIKWRLDNPERVKYHNKNRTVKRNVNLLTTKLNTSNNSSSRKSVVPIEKNNKRKRSDTL